MSSNSICLTCGKTLTISDIIYTRKDLCEKCGKKEALEKILDDFKGRIVAITHKDIPKYDWQEAGYSNAKWKAIEQLHSLFSKPFPEQKVREILEIVFEDGLHFQVGQNKKEIVEAYLKQIMDLVR